MCRFALHRQGQSSHVSTRSCWTHKRARTTGRGCRRSGGGGQPSTDRAKALFPARSDRVSTLGETR
jgi:hypothetical protein